MKKGIIVLIVVLLVIFAGCTEKNTPSSKPDSLHNEGLINNTTGISVNDFTLDATLDDKNHKLVVKQDLTYNNNTGYELKEIYFNLIPEAFKKNGGGIAMVSIRTGDKACQMLQVKETVYKMELPATLTAGEQTKIHMEYDVNIPHIENRFGYQEQIYNLGNFIVTPAVYEKGEWSMEPYVAIGDAFYTDIANYTVTIHTPEGYIVAATGKEDEAGTFHAKNVRDFAFCASNSFKTLNEQYEGTEIKVYYIDDIKEIAEKALDVAKKSLKLYGDSFGAYPYDTLSLVLNMISSGAGGMEYPTLVMVSPGRSVEALGNLAIYKSDKAMQEAYLKAIDNPTYHEIAHQWFYNIVGNDQIASSWIDEGFCRYAEYLYEKTYSPEGESRYWWVSEEQFESMHDLVSNSGKEGYPVDNIDLSRSLYDWENDNSEEYGRIYDKAASLLYQMQKKMGEEQFLAAVKEYVRHFAYQIVDVESFQEFWNDKGDFKDLFELYLKEK